MTLCSYCNRQGYRGKLLCVKKHFICDSCLPKYRFIKCYLCNQQYRCNICKKKPIINIYQCEIHGYCVNCIGIQLKCTTCSVKSNKSQCIACKKKLKVLQISCEHNFCKSCIQQIIANDYDNCPIKICKKKFNKSRLEEVIKLIFQEEDKGSSNLPEIKIKCRKCNKQGKIITKQKPQYYKCQQCKAITCLEHQSLLSKCKCKCEKCLTELEGNQFCKKCNPSSMILDSQTNDQSIKLNNYILRPQTMSEKYEINEIKNQYNEKICKKCGYLPLSNILIDSYCKNCWFDFQ